MNKIMKYLLLNQRFSISVTREYTLNNVNLTTAMLFIYHHPRKPEKCILSKYIEEEDK